MRMERIELSRCFHPGILSPMRLPVPPHSHNILFLFYRPISIVAVKDIGQGPSSYAAFTHYYSATETTSLSIKELPSYFSPLSSSYEIDYSQLSPIIQNVFVAIFYILNIFAVFGYSH